MTDLHGFLINYINPYVSMVLCILLCMVIPYLLGSVNFALVISKIFYHDDIRKYGSGNAGMTNMLRTYGKLSAAGTLLCDMLKAVVSVLLGQLIYNAFGIGGYLAGFFCVLGHIFPIFFKFKGGKGVATALGYLLITTPICGVGVIIVFAITALKSKYISLGSILGSIFAIIYSWVMFIIFKDSYQFMFLNLSNTLGFNIVTTLFALVVIFKHHENIKRLINKNENKIYF